jgi:hypothetical protein
VVVMLEVPCDLLSDPIVIDETLVQLGSNASVAKGFN